MAIPLVSVVIPVWNTGAMLAETLDSVLGQTYRAIEVIVVDDGSTDHATLAVLDRYRASIGLIRQRQQGVGAARNAGIAAASGDYIAFIDHDDIWTAHAVETQVAMALRFPGSGMVIANGIQFDGHTTLRRRLISDPFWTRLVESGAEAVTGHFYEDVLIANPAACPAQTLVPRHVCDRIGSITTDLHEAEDLDYTLRVAAVYPLTVHRQSLVRWRYLASSRSGPLRRRRLVWAASHTRVLDRHRRLSTGERRRVITSRFERLRRDTAKACYDHGRVHPEDVEFSRTYLAGYLWSHPDVFTGACLLGLYMPESLATVLGRVYRRAEQALSMRAGSDARDQRLGYRAVHERTVFVPQADTDRIQRDTSRIESP